MAQMKFVLQCLDRHFPNLELNAEQVGVRLGPSEIDAPYSRVEVFPEYKHARVKIKNLGFTKCLLNFQHVIRKGEELPANAGDIIDLTFGTFLYRIREISQVSNSSRPVYEKLHDTQPQQPSTSQRLSVNIDEEQLQDVLGADSGMVIEDNSCMNLSTTELLQIETSQLSLSEQPRNSKLLQASDWDKIDGILGPLPILVFGENMDKMKSKVAAFDLDETLISPKGGVWNAPINDEKIEPGSLWKFNYESVPETLRKYFKSHPDHKFLIVTNKANRFFEISQLIIQEVVVELDIPVIVFAARQGTEFLKPAPCVWNAYKKYYNEGVEPDWKDSFFCGDCAGRLGDTSKGDRLFALNVGTGFKTPEEFFLGKDERKTSFAMPRFNPQNFVRSQLSNRHILFPYKQEIILMCGCAGSGKTWYVESTLIPKGYYHVHLSEKMGTPRERLHAASAALAKSYNVVIDRRNTDKDEREGYLRMAETMQLPIRCFLMNVPEEHALHNLRFHEMKTGKPFHTGEMELGMKRHRALYEPPTVGEGFTDIVSVNLVPSAFLNKRELELYSKFLIQK